MHFAGGESGKHLAGARGPGNHPAGGEPAKQDSAAPIIEVSGRTYPVETRYRPLADPDDPVKEPRDQVQGIDEAVSELLAEGPGDILVFLSGEREIRDTADALAGRDELDVLPLYARLSAAEQHRVFAGGETKKQSAGGETKKQSAGGETNKQSAGGQARKQGQPHRRRVVLATNIAETSLTVPGIKYVIDPGTARISRYSQRTKVQRLPIEAISQASANQRKGRCGRTSDGVCIRLYSEEDFASRPEFTDPEILRTHLASVILQMAALDLGQVADFPFIDPPDSRHVADGIRLLEELGAVTPGRGRLTLTGTGRKLARLPVDPRLGRMILEADRNGCAREVLIITAALSITDPRERPAESREAADAMHARFAEPGSDFLSFLTLWEYLRGRQRELSSSAFRRRCRREYLHYLRVREWQDLVGQLRRSARDLGIVAGREHGSAADPVSARGQHGGGQHGGGQHAAGSRAAEPVGASRLMSRTGCTRRCWPHLLSQIGMQEAVRQQRGSGQARRERRGPAESPGRAVPVSRSSRTPCWPGSRRRGSSRPSWSRRPGCGPGPPRESSPSGPSRWPPTWSGAQLQRAALGGQPGGSDGSGKGNAVRLADRGGEAGQLRADRPGDGSRAVHSRRPGRGRLGNPPPVLRPQPAAARRGRGPGAPGAAPRHRGRRRHLVRLLRPADTSGRDIRPAFRRLVEEGAGGGAGPADPQPRRSGWLWR
jgi:hypothetical protein